MIEISREKRLENRYKGIYNACSELGHIKTNPACPLYNPVNFNEVDLAKLSESSLEDYLTNRDLDSGKE